MPQCGQVSQFLSSCTLAIWCSNWVVELKVFEHFEHWNGRSLKVRKFQKLFFLPLIIPRNKHRHWPNSTLKNSNGSLKKKALFFKWRFFKNPELYWSNLPQNSYLGRESFLQKSGVQLLVGEGQILCHFPFFLYLFHLVHKKLNIKI